MDPQNRVPGSRKNKVFHENILISPISPYFSNAKENSSMQSSWTFSLDNCPTYRANCAFSHLLWQTVKTNLTPSFQFIHVISKSVDPVLQFLTQTVWWVLLRFRSWFVLFWFCAHPIQLFHWTGYVEACFSAICYISYYSVFYASQDKVKHPCMDLFPSKAKHVSSLTQ